ncbi:helix-turn-helix transcriptional regulator [Hydrogenophaga sp. 2FB]|uniref:helix-turn-helix domain-containing protein n=1 Tax=Hydrogenophaga sp. 2FB TaxID=2502187 RepID=UPI0010F5D9E4|nr:helix-turn-helix transcriptional regulator [Hydrogenophaga sp. 2FB]
MPTFTKVDSEDAGLLLDLGARLRLARKRRGLSAEKVALAAGITRVTLNRLEVGAPEAATLGTLTKVLGALGLSADLMLLARDDKVGHRLRDTQLLEPKKTRLPSLISLQDLPHLREAAAWHIRNPDAALTPAEVYELYERNWRHIEPGKIVGKEAKLLKQLTKTIGKGVLLV